MGNRDDNRKPDRELEDRLRSLQARLDERTGDGGPGSAGKTGSAAERTGFAKALKMSSEFIAAIIVGAALGYFLDHFAGTSPWGMIAFLLLGFVAGVVNVLRSSGEMADPYRSGWARSIEERKNLTASEPSDKEE